MTFRIQRVSDDFAIPGRLDGRVLAVTGAARGMGAAVAIRAAREGARVVGLDILEEDLAATVAQITGRGRTGRGGSRRRPSAR